MLQCVVNRRGFRGVGYSFNDRTTTSARAPQRVKWFWRRSRWLATIARPDSQARLLRNLENHSGSHTTRCLQLIAICVVYFFELS